MSSPCGVAAVTTKHAVGADGSKKETFRLLDLPPELWSRIASMVIEDSCSSLRYLRFSRYNIIKHRHMLLQPSITRVCRVLREETLPIYYRDMEVSWDLYSGEVRRTQSGLEAWLETIGPSNRRHLSKLMILSDADDALVPYVEMLKPFGLGLRLATDVPDVGLYRHMAKHYDERVYKIIQLRSADASSVAWDEETRCASEEGEGEESQSERR